jgi:hypothetical protein
MRRNFKPPERKGGDTRRVFMKNTIKFLGIIALAAIIGFSFTACGDDDDDNSGGNNNGGGTAVTFSGVTANGSATETTTQLTLTFSAAITGLTEANITLSGVDGVEKGSLSGSGPTYTLPIGGFTEGGTLTVAVAKSGYNISGSPKTVTIFYYQAHAAFVGTWKYVGSEALTDSGSRANNFAQTIVITEDQFSLTEPGFTDEYFTYRVDSWWARSLNAAKDGIAAIPASEFVASRAAWTLAPGTDPYTRSAYTAAFPNVYELMGARTRFNGTGYNYTPDKFFLMINNEGTKFVRTSIAVSGTSTSITTCVYVKQAAE